MKISVAANKLQLYNCNLSDGTSINIESIEDSEHIQKESARAILINGFIKEYMQYLLPQDIDSKLHTWDAVHEYYSQYFDTELEHFKDGKLFWLQATIENEVVAWATYEREQHLIDSCYMNLLVVDPCFNRKGIGRELIQAVQKLNLLPHTKFINLLLRKKNKGGRLFYSKLGFKANPAFKRDNFVDVSLLEGWTLKLDNIL